MSRSVQKLLLAIAILLTACGGAGTAASGCGTSSPEAFARNERVPGAGAVRVTRSGLDFLAESAPSLAGTLLAADGGVVDAGGVTTFPIPTSQQTGAADGGTPYTIRICPAGPKPSATPPDCEVEVDMGKASFQLDAVLPNVVRLKGEVPVRLSKLPIAVDYTGVPGLPVTDVVTGAVGVGAVSDAGCLHDPANGNPLTKTVPDVAWKKFPLDVTLPIVAETLEPRDGYTKIDIDAAKIDVKIGGEDIAICATCGAVFDTIGLCGFIVDQAKKSAVDALQTGALGDQLKAQLKTSLCELPDVTKTPQCPKGTLPRDGLCVFATKTSVCAAKLLGTAGRLESALGGLSGDGTLDYLFAANGPLDPAPGLGADDAGYAGHTPNGMTFTLFGGSKPTVISKCVPPVTPTFPVGIPTPDELRANAITPWPAGTTGPHLGFALSGRFLDYLLSGIYSSGALCLGATTEQVDALKTGLLSVVIPSLKNLTFEQRGAAMAIATRPQVPPRIELGTGADLKTDPLLRLKLDRFAIDFYVFHLDRFVRVLTFTADLSIPINLQTAKDEKNPNGGLLPVVGEMGVANAKVTASEMLSEDPAKITSALETVVGGLTNQVGGNIAPVDLAGALGTPGLRLTIPDGGIRRLKKGEDLFLGIFANLEKGPATPAPAGARADLEELEVQKDGMSLSTLSRATLPRLRARFSSASDRDGEGRPRDVEFSYAIDQGARSAWSAAREVDIRKDELSLQGRHKLRVWARVAGQASTEDVTPAEAPFVIDALAPDLDVAEPRSGTLRVDARDFVSDRAALRGRVQLDDDAFGPWLAVDNLASISTGSARRATVEVKDEEGNIGRVALTLIRGRNDPTLAGAAPAAACGCRAAGLSPAGAGEGLALFGAATLLGIALLRRRRAGGRGLAVSWQAVAAVSGLALLPLVPACSCSDEAEPALCGPSCKDPCGPPLPVGMVGAYTSLAKAKSGTLYVSGYADANIGDVATGLYGDLVFGTFDKAKGAVAWEFVDGVPARTDGTCPTADRQGFRGGETEPGDDVGLWTSLALGEGETPLIAYHDATHRTLKFAHKGEGRWQSHVVFEKSKTDIGRYAKLLVVENKPVVIFLVVEPGQGGKQRSRIVLGKSRTSRPNAQSDWTFTDVSVDDDTPCWAGTCAGGEACSKAMRACTKTLGGCAPACAAGTACLPGDGGVPACLDTHSDPLVQSHPDAVGIYLSAAVGPSGIGIVAYDRPHGNLLSFTPRGDSFERHILDGETGSRADGSAKDTGDVGLGASLFITASDEWHIACVDGTKESLVHLVAKGGVNVVARDVVDDGTTPTGAAFADGKHVVGDDATIRVDDAGAVTICYQDATALELRCAVSAPGQAFVRSTVSQPGRFGGFFPQLVPGSREVVSHWRSLDRGARVYTGDVSVLPF